VTNFACSVYSADERTRATSSTPRAISPASPMPKSNRENDMTDIKPICRIVIIGTGVIGASWTALFLAKGLHVVAIADAALRKFVETAWPALKRLGLSRRASQSNPWFTQAVANADLVQENGPERSDFKQKLYAELDQMLPPHVIIASSSSGLTMSEIQSPVASRAMRRPRVQSAALDPAGRDQRRAKTSEETIRRATEFSTAIGQRTMRLNKEVPGHVANRSRLNARSAGDVSDILTARERDVLAMIRQGCSNKRIARTLEISPETVKSHVKRIFLKLAVSTRTEAAFRAVSLEL
jgi:DNA-binding CsgD family transcriptional regulator